ncbi:MAG: hypothetical protein OEM46_03440 [Ignavibacteria bacterium]|nr:hypothetical protein [Ignavibacteria bacterium]
MNNKRTSGFWFVMISGILIVVLLLLGQTMSFINYEFTVSLGLQEPVDQIGKIGVAVNKAFGVGDTIIYIPLLIVGLIGLWHKKKWGIWSMVAALGITAYWPVVCLFIIFFSVSVPEVNFTDVYSYVVVLGFITLYGLWGIWYLYKIKIN